MSVLAFIGALGVGLALGLTGSGGSILAFPVLIHLAGVAPRDAVPMSLLIVGLAALTGAIQRAVRGNWHLPAACWFGFSGIIGALVGARFTHLLPPAVLIMLFAVIMVIVGIRMWLGKTDESAPEPECKPLRCFSVGAGVGVLTGFLGVGGGFLLLPALTRFARLPVNIAAGTSLAIIAVNALGGFLGHLPRASIDWPVALVFSAVASLFVLLGGRLASGLNPRRLKRVFAGVVLITAVGMVVSALRS